METPPPPARPPRPPLTYRKLFRWGLVFWVLLWLASACSLQIIHVGMKSGGAAEVQIGNGGISARLDFDSISWPEGAYWGHEEIWSPDWLALIREYPEILIAKLGLRGWQLDRIDRTPSIPFVGILFLWLAAGLYGEARFLRHSSKLTDGAPVFPVGFRKRVAVLGCALSGLVAFVYFADHMAREADMAVQCCIEVQALKSGSLPLPKYCPAGGRYLLSPIRPPNGTPSGQCPRAAHRRFYAGFVGHTRRNAIVAE